MFIISQMLLQQLKICNASNVPVYSIAVGLVFYACIYLYMMFYNNEYVYIFNKFVIYIIGIDLLLSAFVYMRNETSLYSKSVQEVEEMTKTEETENDEEEIEVESIVSSELDYEDENAKVEKEDADEVDVDKEIQSFSEQLRQTPPVTADPPKKKRGRPPKIQEPQPQQEKPNVPISI